MEVGHGHGHGYGHGQGNGYGLTDLKQYIRSECLKHHVHHNQHQTEVWNIRGNKEAE